LKRTPIAPAINVDIATGTRNLLNGIYPVSDITNTTNAVKQFKTIITINEEILENFILLKKRSLSFILCSPKLYYLF